MSENKSLGVPATPSEPAPVAIAPSSAAQTNQAATAPNAPAHTPLPWVAGEVTVFARYAPQDGGDVIADAPAWARDSMARWPANAEFIVRACNSHYELLAALKAITAGNNTEGKERWSLVEVIQEHYRIARQAIAKAEGK